jgi:hypothetical protein
MAVAALERTVHLFFALVERKGGSPEVARQYRHVCEEAGLRFIEQRGWFWADSPRELLASICTIQSPRTVVCW